jgi:hypothetical protein
MSNTKAFIDYTLEDNGSSAREALYAEIHDRVMSHIEAKKMELAGGMLTREEKECDYDDMKELKKAKKKVKKLKEELALMEESGCDMDSDDYAEKKKKLKKAKKKVKKLKENFESVGGSEEESEEDDIEPSDEELNESAPNGDDYLKKHKIKDIDGLVTHLTKKIGHSYDTKRPGNQKQYSGHAVVHSDVDGGIRINRAELQKHTGITRAHITKLHKAQDHSENPYQTHHEKTHTEIHPVDIGDEN